MVVQYVWPVVKNEACVHDSYLCSSYPAPNNRPWPTQRKNGNNIFCQQPLNEYSSRKYINPCNNSLCLYIYRYIYNCPFCIRNVVMSFLKIPLIRKNYNIKENREQSLIPFLLQAFLSLSQLLHNSMSKELFREASKHRNNKQEEKRKLNRKENGRESLMSSFALSIFQMANGDNIREGARSILPLYLFNQK